VLLGLDTTHEGVPTLLKAAVSMIGRDTLVTLQALDNGLNPKFTVAVNISVKIEHNSYLKI
jgi:hypothetical protein